MQKSPDPNASFAFRLGEIRHVIIEIHTPRMILVNRITLKIIERIRMETKDRSAIRYRLEAIYRDYAEHDPGYREEFELSETELEKRYAFSLDRKVRIIKDKTLRITDIKSVDPDI